jgi:phosphatidylinositol glycan class H protein
MGSYMGQQEHVISDGMYNYKHHHAGGADIHVIFVKKSKFRVVLSYIGTMLLLATVCCTLLSKVFFLK